MGTKILLASTASPACDDAARVAFDLAKRYNANLTILHVIGIPVRGFSNTVIDIRTGEEVVCDDDYIEWVKEELRSIYSIQIEQYKNCIMESVPGVPHREILRFARKNNTDLIVMGTGAKKECIETAGYTRYVSGSTMQAVAKAARCPVLIIGRPAASFWGGISKIVFGTDFSKAADSAFMFALNIARKIGCRLYIFHAINILPFDSEKIQLQDEIEDKIKAAKEKIRKKYVTRMKDFKNYNIDVWEGVPYVEIVKFARENYSDLIVMAHHARDSDLNKTRLGSTIEQVVLRASCPVISVNHPDKIGDL